MTATTPNSTPDSTLPRAAFLRGILNALPFVIVIVPFALLFGVVATEAGLPLSQVMGFSVLVVAGASQFAALQVMSENAPTLIVLASALAVNLRMAMYSAALTPYLGQTPLWQRALMSYFLIDQTYVLAHEAFQRRPALTTQARVAYFAGLCVPICPLWYLSTWIGAVLGARIPAEYGLDFMVPIAFLAMVAPALRTVAHMAAAFVSIVLSLVLIAVPFNLGLLIAAIAAMAVGAEVERRRP